MADTLRDAYQLFIKKKYSDVIRILEPQVFRFRGDFNFFHLLGMSCLHQGDYGGAFSYLRRAVDIRDDDVNTLLGIAAVYLKRGDSANAIRMWLDIIEMDPNNIYAQRGLNYMKKTENPDEFADIAVETRIMKFIPQPSGRKKFPKSVFIILLAAAALASAVLFTPAGNLLREFISVDNRLFASGRENRPGIPEISLDARKDFIDVDSTEEIVLSEKEIEKKIREIQDYLYSFRDNLAQKEINIILKSNASEYIKDRARLLGRYVSEPELTEFTDNFSWDEVSSRPAIYDGCYVLWKGRAANVRNSEQSIDFDFLVGYHDGKSLDGKLPVSFGFSVRIVPDQPVEILAQVLTDDYGNIRLRGIAVRRLN